MFFTLSKRLEFLLKLLVPACLVVLTAAGGIALLGASVPGPFRAMREAYLLVGQQLAFATWAVLVMIVVVWLAYWVTMPSRPHFDGTSDV